MKKSNEKEVSELWVSDFFSDEVDLAALPVIARLIFKDNVSSIVALRGSTQVLLAPLLLVAENPEGCTVSLRLRDYSNRENRTAGGLMPGEQCIRRLFKLTFSEHFEAVAFHFCHNLFLNRMGEVPEETAVPAPSEAAASTNEVDANEETTMDKDKSVDLLNKTMGEEEEEDEVDNRRAIFEATDETTFFDDIYEYTQDKNAPDSDDSFLLDN